MLTTLAALGATRAGAQPPDAPPIADLLIRLQASYDAMADFAADFEQRYAGGVLRTTDIEHGTMWVKKPGRWRFDYTHPEEKRFVSDGETIHAYFPADRQVIVSRPPTGGGASTPALFLAGVGDLTRDFVARYADAAATAADGWVVELTPIRDDADYERLTLTLDRDTLDIRQLATTDLQGGVSTYVFAKLTKNQGLSDTFFAFDVPDDVEVLTDDGFTR